jgi:hypothetical protein
MRRLSAPVPLTYAHSLVDDVRQIRALSNIASNLEATAPYFMPRPSIAYELYLRHLNHHARTNAILAPLITPYPKCRGCMHVLGLAYGEFLLDRAKAEDHVMQHPQDFKSQT